MTRSSAKGLHYTYLCTTLYEWRKVLCSHIGAVLSMCAFITTVAAQDTTLTPESSFQHFFSTPIDTSIATQSPMQQIRDESGLYYIDFAYGKGDSAVEGKRHFIRFIGARANGILFDTSFSGNRLFSFVMGKNEVLHGLELGIRGMRCGGRRLLTLPPKLAYGVNGFSSVGIGMNETLTFYVELVKVE